MEIGGKGYRLACALYDLPPMERPQVVQKGEVAVREAELRAAKAEAVSVAGGVLKLAVNVLETEVMRWNSKN